MKTTIALIADNHFIFSNDGKVYVNGTYTQQYLKRFTSCFDEVVVVCRGRNCDETDDLSKYRLSGGNNVSFLRIPDFRGVAGYIAKKAIITRIIRGFFEKCDAVFIRMPCILTTIAINEAKRASKPYMIDVGADPSTIYKKSTFSLTRSIISCYLAKICKKACLSANGVSYVTESVLQKKYPCRALLLGETDNFFTESISNVDISLQFFFDKRLYERSSALKLLHVSNNIPNHSGKGHIESIKVLEYLVDHGVDATLTFVGDGDGIRDLKNECLVRKLEDRVFFAGRIMNRDDYRNVFIDHDFFIFPSHSEGLPRVVIEAMSTGMVCVTSNADGLPELIQKDLVFDFCDTNAMASKINELSNDTDKLNDISKRNFKKALQYSDIELKKRYVSFYSKVKSLINKKK